MAERITSLRKRKDLQKKLKETTHQFFDYESVSLEDMAGNYVIIKKFVKGVPTKFGAERMLFIIEEVDQDVVEDWEEDPEEVDLKTGNTYKMFSSSKRINDAVKALEEEDPTCFPLLVKLIKRTFKAKSKKTGKIEEFTSYEIDLT